MAFENISSVLYEVGRAIRKELFTKVVGNINDLNDRTTNLEQGASKVVIWNDSIITRGNTATLTGIDLWQSPAQFTLLDAKVAIFEKGSTTGIVEMDIQKSVNLDPNNFQSVFTTKPSVDYDDIATQDYDESTNAVFDINQTVVGAGQWLRLDMSSLPTPNNRFQIYLIGEFN